MHQFFRIAAAFLVLTFSALDQVISDSTRDQLAIKINCQKDEIRDYRYSSETNLFGDVDGKIVIAADVKLHCLGNDAGGKFGPEGLKYLIQLDNLHINDMGPSKEDPVLKRRKRGFMDSVKSSVSNAWKKVKTFFKQMFGAGESKEEIPDPVVVETEERIHTGQHSPPADPKEEEAPNDFNYEALYSAPFKFVQLPNGSVPEVEFLDEDKDVRVRNFKRHLVDAFTTQLNMHPRHEVVVETTVLGEHLSNYNISISSETAAFSSSSLHLEGEGLDLGINSPKTVVVEKLITEDDILQLAPNSEESAAINDKDKMGLHARQTQIFKNGQLISTSGTSTLVLFETTKKRRTQRDADANDIMSFFQVRSSFDIQLQNRRKRRSTDDVLQFRDGDYHFSVAGRGAELEDSAAKQKLRDLQMSIGNTTLFIRSLLDDKDSDEEEKIQIVFEMVVQEVRFGLDHETESISEAIRKSITKEVIDSRCPASLKNCTDLLQLLARAGGLEAEGVLLSYVKSESIAITDRQEIADLLSDLSNPSEKIINQLTELLQRNFFDPRLIGPLSLSASNIAAATKKSVGSEKQLETLATVLVDILRASWNKYEVDPLTVDALEAIGNLGHASAVDYVLEISNKAKERTDIQIACAHALRHVPTIPRVQSWMLSMILSSPCDVKHAIVGSLLDQVYVQELSGEEEWPRFGVNAVDLALQKNLNSPEFTCAADDIIRYFKRKRGDEAENLTVTNYFTPDTEAWEPENSKGARRKKRALSINDLNCREWIEDNKYRPIQDKDEFAADRATYNRSRSCLASRRLGLDNANTEIYAGMFAGVQDLKTEDKNERPKYKLLTKFVSGMNFMGHELELGSFYFYHHSGYTKAYVRILGRTRQEFRHEGCTPNDLKYRPIMHIPLYRISISVIQLSLGIHISSQLALNTECPQYDVYDLRPMTDVRIGGEAMGTVLFARASLNLGGNFNYHLLFSFSPNPGMCLKGQHGHDPMSVSMEAYFRLWNIRRLRWGKPLIWRPSSLIWDLNSEERQPWFNDTCILTDPPAERNEATTTTTAGSTASGVPDTVENDNNVLIVQA